MGHTRTAANSIDPHPRIWTPNPNPPPQGGRGFAPALSAVSFANEMCPCDSPIPLPPAGGEGANVALPSTLKPLMDLAGVRRLRVSSDSRFLLDIERLVVAPGARL